jgi:hypothetical protein
LAGRNEKTGARVAGYSELLINFAAPNNTTTAARPVKQRKKQKPTIPT